MDAQAQSHIDAATRRMLERIADDIVADARRFAPVDTGRLRDSISRGPASSDHVAIAAYADYAAYVELGTSRQPAQPFLRPATLRRREVSS